MGLIKLADLQVQRDPKSGVALYEQATQLIGNKPEADHAFIRLGLAAIEQRNYDLAFGRFQDLQRIDPSESGIALMWMAVVRQKQKNFEEADHLYQDAVAAQDPSSVDAAPS